MIDSFFLCLVCVYLFIFVIFCRLFFSFCFSFDIYLPLVTDKLYFDGTFVLLLLVFAVVYY